MATEDTKTRLIEAAERLFGERGIDGVSLRQVAAAAGQRNTAAIHYHFGCKEALIDGIFERRMAAIDAQRLARLDELTAGERAPDLREVLAAAAWPLAEHILAGAGGRAYILFVAQVYGRSHAAVADAITGGRGRGWQEVFVLADGLVPDVPAPLLATRFELTAGSLVYALADYVRGFRAGRELDEVDFRLFVDNLIDTMVGALTAPVSAATRQAVDAAVGG